jgi:hypothetical protein
MSRPLRLHEHVHPCTLQMLIQGTGRYMYYWVGKIRPPKDLPTTKTF